MKLPPRISIDELNGWTITHLYGHYKRMSGIAHGALVCGDRRLARAFAEVARETFQQLVTEIENERRRYAA